MVKLNLGCGKDIQSEYINIDIRSTDSKVLVADVRHLPFKNGTIDEIRAIDVYEHISFRESQYVLNHWGELLKLGGLLHIQSPSLLPLCVFALNAKDVKSKEIAIVRFFGGQDYPENSHYTSVEPELIRFYLRKANFQGPIRLQDGGFGNGTNIRIWAIK